MFPLSRPSLFSLLSLSASLLPLAFSAPAYPSYPSLLPRAAAAASEDNPLGSLCRKTALSGALQVNAPQTGHGAIAYTYPLAANDSGVLVTTSAADSGEEFTFYNCAAGQYNGHYNVTTRYPLAFGLLQSQRQPSQCLSITRLPANTPPPNSGDPTAYVPFSLRACPALDSYADINDADPTAALHYSWYSIGRIDTEGVFEVDFKGDSTDAVPFVQGSAGVGKPAQAYYGFTGPQYGHLELISSLAS